MITELKRIHSLDPEHLPAEIALMEYLIATLDEVNIRPLWKTKMPIKLLEENGGNCLPFISVES